MAGTNAMIEEEAESTIEGQLLLDLVKKIQGQGTCFLGEYHKICETLKSQSARRQPQSQLPKASLNKSDVYQTIVNFRDDSFTQEGWIFEILSTLLIFQKFQTSFKSMQTPTLLVLDSYSLGGRFANNCPVCYKKIIYQQSWALCNCPIFFHSQCFLNSINKRDLTQQPKLKCLYCQQMYEVEYATRAQIKCKKNMEKKEISLIIILAISLGVGIFLAIQSAGLLSSEIVEENMRALYYFMGTVLCLVCFTVSLGKLLITICLKQSVSAVSVRQLQRSIQFSAFKDIGMSQENSNCMILH